MFVNELVELAKAFEAEQTAKVHERAEGLFNTDKRNMQERARAGAYHYTVRYSNLGVSEPVKEEMRKLATQEGLKIQEEETCGGFQWTYIWG